MRLEATAAVYNSTLEKGGDATDNTSEAAKKGRTRVILGGASRGSFSESASDGTAS